MLLKWNLQGATLEGTQMAFGKEFFDKKEGRQDDMEWKQPPYKESGLSHLSPFRKKSYAGVIWWETTYSGYLLLFTYSNVQGVHSPGAYFYSLTVRDASFTNRLSFSLILYSLG